MTGDFYRGFCLPHTLNWEQEKSDVYIGGVRHVPQLDFVWFVSSLVMSYCCGIHHAP